MPDFGLGVGDLMIFVAPFALLYLLRRLGVWRYSIGAGGFVIVGVFCLFARGVSLRYCVYFEGCEAVAIGLLYMAGGTTHLIWQVRGRGCAKDARVPTKETPDGGQSEH